MSRQRVVGLLFILMMLVMELSGIFTFFIPEQFMMDYGQFINILIPVIVIGILIKDGFRERFKLNGFKLSIVLVCIGIAIAVLPVTGFLGDLSTFIFGRNPIGIESYVMELKGSLFTQWIILALTPAICEEALFRGLLLDKKAGLNIHTLAIMNGLMFSLFHIGYDQLLYTFALGVIMAYLAIITSSIFPAVILHLINNSWSILAQGAFGKLTAEETAEMMASQVTFSSLSISLIYGIIGSIIIVFLIKRLMKKYKYNDRERLKENAQDKVIYAVENKAITYLPQIIMFFLVLLANYLLISM